MGEGLPACEQACKHLSGNRLGAGGWEGAGSGAAEAEGEKMAREAAFLGDLGWAVGGGRTRAGGLPLRRQELRPGSGVGWGRGTKTPSGPRKKDPPLPGRSGSRYRKFIIEESHLHAE